MTPRTTIPHTARARSAATITLALLAAALPACRSASNGDASLAHDSVRLAAFDQDAAASLPLDRPFPERRPAPLPIDRSAWATTTIVVPVDTVESPPTLATNTHLAFAARERNEFPSLIESTRWTDRQTHEQVAEAGYVIGITAFDTIMLVPRALFLQPLWTTSRDRDADFARTRTEGWLARSTSPFAPADAGTPGFPPPSVVKRFPQPAEASQAEPAPGPADASEGDNP